MINNYAHRGASAYYPENTMISFEKAVELGANGIETDVQMTSDGVLVLIHDEYVNRTTNGEGLVRDFTYDELNKLDAGSWFDKKYNTEKIPTAKDLIIFAKENNIILNLELKNGVIVYPGMEEKLIEMIYKYNYEDKVILSSFNHYSMVHCKEIDKQIKTGILYMAGLYQPEVYCKRIGADALHPYFYSVNKEIIDNAKKEGILVNPFTVNEEDCMKSLIKAGVDGLITNYPDKLKRVLLDAKK
ncbi:glycerophosphodiester phosphodiesterase [Clostridium algoriphilum]|uniref:glycerophosphodiester phosphodiesterase n=1 Tax=Clostridium algoriphilum TaxID=198347 RepID=UPI001CF13FB4|nr:glycerophosphodiester phosphodiesterase [Clostridium algoriphilum]MCB2295578.1 glycerophosphodiester phosphodiesterase [Clostridium algoriphilum]